MSNLTSAHDCATCPAHNPGNLKRLGINMDSFDYVVALAGNPNTGKSTVFNALTGLRQHTGNWPGKTVTRAEGGFEFDNKKYKIIDLPGTYSLLSTSTDEEVARDFILFGQPDVTVIVVDASRLERNLNLVLQVLEITDRAVLCLNLIDEARRHKIEIDVRSLSRELGIPVVATAARQNEGIPELLKMKKCPQPKNFHSEGDVWQHTRLALEIANSKKFEKEFGEKADAEIIIATLFHDIAKPYTITYPKKADERIRFDGHDAKGAQMTKEISERLKLSSYKEKNIDVDAERLSWFIKHHILLANGNPKEMRATNIEKYYLRDLKLGRALLALQFSDGSATINPKGEPALKEYKVIKKRIAKLTRGQKKKKLPDPVLNGNEIMKVLKLKPGKEIGRLILILREAQLSGKVKTKKDALKLLLNL